MKHNREFEIAWQGLKPGPHTYVYDIDDEFMHSRDADPGFKNWKARITLGFDKHESFFQLIFDIDGKVTVPCDRCGDDFELSLWDEFKLVIKLIGSLLIKKSGILKGVYSSPLFFCRKRIGKRVLFPD